MKEYAIFTAILVTMFLQASLIAENKVVPSIEIISTDPPCPAILEPGQRLYIKMRYNAGDAESFRVWVRPTGSTPGCKSHPCKSITKKTGEYEGWFFFDSRAAVINEITAMIKDDKAEGYMFEKTYPLKAEWKAPKGEGPQGYCAGNASVEVISTDPPCPAILEPGQKLNMKVRYNADGAKSCEIWTYVSRGGETRRHLSLKEDHGIFDSYISFADRAVDSGMMRFVLYDNDAKRYLVDYRYQIDAKWKAPIEKTAKQNKTPKNADPFAVIEDAIAKEHARKYEGFWTSEIIMPDGKKHPVVIKTAQSKNSVLSFSFLQHPFTSKPVFEKHSIDQYRAKVYFKLDSPEKALMYSLAREGNDLAGNLHLSWQDNPQKVTLRKMDLSRAVERLYEKNTRLEQLNESYLKYNERFKKHIDHLQAKLKTSESEKREIETSFARTREIYKKQQQECQDVIKELQILLSTLKKKNEVIAEE